MTCLDNLTIRIPTRRLKKNGWDSVTLRVVTSDLQRNKILKQR